MTLSDPGVQWTDEEGITHYRGTVYTAEVVGQEMDGVPIIGTAVQVYNINIDLVTGDGDLNATITAEQSYRDLAGTWTGSFVGTISGFMVSGTFSLPRGGGDFAGWHSRGVFGAVFGSPTSQWEGIYHIPGGDGGDKAAVSDPRTWSDAKVIYR